MRKISYTLLALLSLSTPSYALIFTVPDGTTEIDPLKLSKDGDSAIIEKGGEITTGPTAVIMETDNQTVLNQGKISTTGNDALGIFNDGGANAVITNSGRISTEGNDAYGIFNDGGNNAVITNSGLISTEGDVSLGIFNDGGNNAVIMNSGLISTTGNGADGILNFGNNAVITNSGLISITGNGVDGIVNTGDDAVITNSGLISIEGNNADGIANGGANDNVVITNSGLISTTGNNADGIFNDGDNLHIINSGTIRSARGNALNLLRTDTTLSLLRGSNLQGPVNNTDPLNLNVETGLNLALMLSGGGGFGNLRIEAPFVHVDDTDTVGVIDPTGLALQADVVADLSDTILDGIYRHRTAFPCQCNPCGCGVWAKGMGSYRERSRKKTMGYDNWQGGFLVGYDTNLCGGNVSLFGGVSFGEAQVDEKTQKADTTSYVGGLTYERLFCNTFLGLAVAVGYIDWDNERFVMNNDADGGVEKARADSRGVFVSPEVTLAHHCASLLYCPTMSFTLRYAGLFFFDYSEKGSLTNLSVKDREIDLLTTRFEVAIPYSDSQGICCWSVEPYAGVFKRFQVGGNHVDGKLLGQSLRFDPGSPRNLTAFLLGVRGIQSFGCFHLFINLEGSFDNYRSSRILGNGGIGFCF